MKQYIKFQNYAFHIIFWIAVSIIFTHYSYLRPICIQNAYKEVLCVLIIAMIVYLNKFIFVPRIYLKGKYLRFWLINVLLILSLGFIELQIVKSDIFKIYGNLISVEDYSRYLIYVFILVSLRDAAFLAFFFIIWVNRNMQYLLKQRNQLLATENKQIIVTSAQKEILLNVGDIVYISSERNITTLHLINGEKYKQYHSLAYMEEALPDNLWVRINRSCIVMYAYVCEYNEKEVTIIINKHSKKLTIPFQQTKQIEIFEILKKNVLPNVKKTNDEIEKGLKNNENRKIKDDFDEINENAKQILDTIRENPSIFASEIKKKLPLISDRNIDRYLRKLKNLGLIEYKGALKNGGYFPV